MQRIAIACAALAFAIVASPATAQQTLAEQQLAPPAETPLPPFPHYPKAEPSHRCVNTCGGHHSSSHHQASTHHKSTKAKKASHKHGKAGHESRHQAKHFSKKTIRQCHKMTYKEIMAHRNCRDMMTQDLDKAGHKKTHSKSSKHHKSSKHQKSTTHHKSTKHHH